MAFLSTEPSNAITSNITGAHLPFCIIHNYFMDEDSTFITWYSRLPMITKKPFDGINVHRVKMVILFELFHIRIYSINRNYD